MTNKMTNKNINKKNFNIMIKALNTGNQSLPDHIMMPLSEYQKQKDYQDSLISVDCNVSINFNIESELDKIKIINEINDFITSLCNGYEFYEPVINDIKIIKIEGENQDFVDDTNKKMDVVRMLGDK